MESVSVLGTADLTNPKSPCFEERHIHVTLGTADWKTMLRMGWGAVLSMETTTTSTSERPGSGSRAKWKRTRKPCWSYTVTGKMLPGRGDGERGRESGGREREKGQERERTFPGPCPVLSSQAPGAQFLKEFIPQKSPLQGPHIHPAAG